MTPRDTLASHELLAINPSPNSVFQLESVPVGIIPTCGHCDKMDSGIRRRAGEESLLYLASSSSDEDETTALLHQRSPTPPLRGLDKTSAFTGPRSLGLVQLLSLTFFSISGGPFGMEVAVAAGGPALALLASSPSLSSSRCLVHS